MKSKILIASFVSFLFVFSFVSAIALPPVCSTVETTYVSGTITGQSNENVAGASVDVTCNGYLRSTTSDANGGYLVEYSASECDNGDDVSVSATYNNLNGQSDSVAWYTENTQIGCLQMIINVACADVPLVPEFGFFVGGLTLVSAIGVFFFVRKA